MREDILSEEDRQSLKISDAIFDEFYNKNIPLSIGLAAIRNCFMVSCVEAKISLSDFLRITSAMTEIIVREEEKRRSSQK